MDKYQDLNPRELMDLAKNGNRDAFGALYELYFVPVFRYIFLRTKDKKDSEDLTQTVFLKVYSSISRFQEHGKSPLAYFFTVARNTVIDYWKKKREVVVNDLSETPETSHDHSDENLHRDIEREEAAKSIHEALDKLSEEQEKVVVLKFINEFSNREIADLLGKSEEAVRQLQCRALKALRQHLKDAL
jgi:RNA polymerase sigma-70 factor (ECF subfamily)